MAAGEGPVRMEDVAGVRSRLSWQAIIAGAVAAVATNFVLTLFFAAIGVTLTEAGVRGNAIGAGALIAMICSFLVALFIGGWFSAQLTAGETDREAALYGILTWATVMAISVAVVGMGVRAGYYAVMGSAIVVQQSPAVQNASNWEQAARDAGVSSQQIDSARASIDRNRAQASAAANDPEARARAEAAVVAASWIALVGVLLGLGCCIGGAMVGRGPALRLFQPRVQIESRQELIIP